MLSDTYADIIDASFFAMTGINYTFKYITEDEVETFVEPVVEQQVEEKEIEWNTNLNPKFTFDNYVVGNSNRLAFVAARAVAEAPGTIHNPLFIYGRSGIGKTHLMQAIGNYIEDHSNLKVLYTTSNEFRDEFTGIANSNNKIGYANDFKNKYRNVDVLIIDDIQFLVEAEKTQQEFFHTFNALHQANKQILQTICKKVGIPEEKYSTETFTKYANCASSSVFTVILDNINKAKDTILLSSFGIGLAWAAAVIKFNDFYNGGISIYKKTENVLSRQELIQYWIDKFTGEK